MVKLRTTSSSYPRQLGSEALRIPIPSTGFRDFPEGLGFFSCVWLARFAPDFRMRERERERERERVRGRE